MDWRKDTCGVGGFETNSVVDEPGLEIWLPPGFHYAWGGAAVWRSGVEALWNQRGKVEKFRHSISLHTFPMRITQPLLASLTVLFAGLLQAQVEVVATGLQSPQKLILTQRGNFLATETNLLPNSGRVSFVSRSGVRRNFMTGLPSGTDVTGGASGPNAMSLRERTLSLAIGGGDVERRDATGQSIDNPAGVSSPIFNSVLEIRLSTDIDSLAGSFTMTPEHQQTLADGREVELSDGAGGVARVALLVDFPDSLPDGKLYRFSNIWGLALSTDGTVLWVIDASQNLLYRVETATKLQQIFGGP